MSIPSGWYPNPDGTPTQRWWTGESWSEHVGGAAAQPIGQPISTPYGSAGSVAQPYVAPGLRAPDGTSASTVPFWLFALTPLLSLLTFAVVNVSEYVRLSMSADQGTLSNSSDVMSQLAATGYFNALILSAGIWVLTIVLAAVDSSVLKRRGVPRPFGWGWTFLSPLIYLVGRPIVASRRGARGSRGPVILYIVAYVLTFIITIVITIGIVAPSLSSYSTYSS